MHFTDFSLRFYVCKLEFVLFDSFISFLTLSKFAGTKTDMSQLYENTIDFLKKNTAYLKMKFYEVNTIEHLSSN